MGEQRRQARRVPQPRPQQSEPASAPTQVVLDDALRGASFVVRKRFGMLVRGERAVGLPDSLGLEGNGGGTNRNQALKVLGGLVAAVAVPEEVGSGWLVTGRAVRIPVSWTATSASLGR